MDSLVSNEKRAKTTLVLLYITIGLELLMGVIEYFDIRRYQGFREQGMSILEIEFLDITSFDLLLIGSGLVYIIIRIILIIFFIMWLRRSYTNLSRRINTEYTPGWAAGAWFVPFLNLVRPFQIVREIWNKLQNYLQLPEVNKDSGHIGIWWACFLISGFLSRISSRMVLRAEDINDYITGSFISIVSGFLSIAAAFFLIKIVKEIVSFEELFIANDTLASTDISEHLIE